MQTRALTGKDRSVEDLGLAKPVLIQVISLGLCRHNAAPVTHLVEHSRLSARR
jgi:hypothetical protein